MENEVVLGNMHISSIDYDIIHTIKQHKMKHLTQYITTLSKLAVKDKNATLQIKYDFVMSFIGIERLDCILHKSAVIYLGCYMYQTPDDEQVKLMDAIINLFINLGITMDEFKDICSMYNDSIDHEMYPIENYQDHMYKPHSTLEVLNTLEERMMVLLGNTPKEWWDDWINDPYFNCIANRRCS